MSDDRTQQQSAQQLRSSEDLSRKAKTPPSQVDGYSIQELVGAGAYGEVWSALDQKTGRRVAIKFYTRQRSLDFTLLSREVEKLAFLSADRYVVQLLDVGWDAKPPHFVMDYIETGSLEDALNRRGTLPVGDAVALFEEIAIGLMHLHGKGILHCDLKPGNVLLDQDFKPRLADFGQSRLTHEQVPSVGTLFFMAPEQADLNAAPDARWDVYALGALLYRMLVGFPPYRDEAILRKVESAGAIEDRLEQYRQLIDSAPKPIGHRKVKGVDRNLAEIVDRCIAKSPKDRFASVQSVLLALRQREVNAARRPLFVLGVLGPLLLLVIMSLFAYNAYHRALSQSDQAISQKSLESNYWAAQLAASSATAQIEEYSRVVNQLALDPDLQTMLAAVSHDSETRAMIDQLADPHRNGDPSLDALRQEFIDHPLRAALQGPLDRNLGDPRYPLAASWFVCDHTGTQIASVFNQDNPDNTIGKNYAYRTYFTGRDSDAVAGVQPIAFDVSSDPQQRQHINGPHISAIFRSKATQTWKIAFSTPVHDSQNGFLGIVAVTADMGSFVDFENTAHQYAMLVDARPGEFTGAILEHPLIESVIKDNNGIWPEHLSAKRVDFRQFRSDSYGGESTSDFRDPFAEDPLGKAFDRHWMASAADVQHSVYANSSPPRIDRTGLQVIAAEDYQNALRPTRQLGGQLARTATFALLFFLLVTAGLLLVVSRLYRQSHERFSRIFLQNGDSVSLHEAKTLRAAPTD